MSAAGVLHNWYVLPVVLCNLNVHYFAIYIEFLFSKPCDYFVSCLCHLGVVGRVDYRSYELDRKWITCPIVLHRYVSDHSKVAGYMNACKCYTTKVHVYSNLHVAAGEGARFFLWE